MELIWIALVVGAVVGIALSVVFGVYSKATAESYVRTLFGISSYNLIVGGVILLLSVSFLFLATISGVIRDLKYPNAYPFRFTLETLLMGFLSSGVFLVMTVLRGYPINTSVLEDFSVLVAKFGALHVLLQFSGFYSNIFPPK
jgi:hypothetical protein